MPLPLPLPLSEQAWAEKLSSRCGLAAGNQGELAAFCAYARSYATNFLAHVDTYDALKSGLSNFLAVSLALHSAGYAPVGIALDSGDLAYQSKEARRVFRKVADTFEIPSFRYALMLIVLLNSLASRAALRKIPERHSVGNTSS
eukprot:COSAG06_NODE_929_length_11465_cov_4.106722_8_plen_144_part_00